MAARTSVRLEPLARDIALLIDEELSPAAQAQKLTEAAREALLDAQGTNRQALGYVPDHDTFIDGGKRSDLSGVRASSIITFEFHLLIDVIQWVDEQLIIHSPVKTERFARSHVWFADNVEMDPLNPPPAESYIVLNEQPYTRKIEKGLSPQAPDGVYEAVATLAKRRFGNIAYVGFSFRSFPGGAVGKWADSASAAKLAKDVRGGRQSQHRDWLTRQPCIYIDPGR
ncbi:hypothetical protein FPV16_23840 [Methylobacterium sp. W2]|uniref:hypothetical protein n=1 Tax=Methylobacterium sp. W2 TaxID=2598107 RepID=UPI001D0C0F37|nr:hypothetical protein [Methylobacterium sp. W2]MCC0809191.1 hypothetical protein [Methylobacterium sp. W2]